MSCFIQYHNCGKLGRWPSIAGDADDNDGWGGIFAKKKFPLVGEKIYLIAGVRQEGKSSNDYFLWEYIDVRECVEEDGFYIYRGPQYPCKMPVYLNDVPGFDDLKKAVANFSTGLQDRSKCVISKFICDEKLYMPLSKIKNPLEWQCDFEDRFIVDELWRDTMRDETGTVVEIPVEEE